VKEITVARPRKPARREKLSRERIEEAALELIDRDGVDGFSTRKLAAELGCEAMSIYHYFPSRVHLTDALVDRFVGDVGLPDPGLPPLDRIRRVAMNYRKAALRHPNLYQVIATHRLNTPTGVRLINGVLEMFVALGFDVEMRARLFRVLGYYINGAALDETLGYAKGPSAAEPISDEAVARDFPEAAAVNPYFKAAHHEATFLAGLDILLKGIADAPKAARSAGRVRRGGGRSSRSSRSSSR
jgi:AcrR family transcriptional regulator